MGIWCQNVVVLTSMRRDDVASTSIQRHFDTKCPLGLEPCVLGIYLRGSISWRCSTDQGKSSWTDSYFRETHEKKQKKKTKKKTKKCEYIGKQLKWQWGLVIRCKLILTKCKRYWACYDISYLAQGLQGFIQFWIKTANKVWQTSMTEELKILSFCREKCDRSVRKMTTVCDNDCTEHGK